MLRCGHRSENLTHQSGYGRVNSCRLRMRRGADEPRGDRGASSRRAAPLTLSNGSHPDRKGPPPTASLRSHTFRPLCGRPAPLSHTTPRGGNPARGHASTPGVPPRPIGAGRGPARTEVGQGHAPPPTPDPLLPPRMPAPEVRNPALVGATPPVRGRRSVHSGVGVHEAAHSARRVRHRTHMPMEPNAGPTRRTPRTVPLKLGSWRACPRAPLGTACTGGSARLGSAPGRSRTPHTGDGGPQEWNAGRERRANRRWEWTCVLRSGAAPVPHDFVAHRAPAPAAPQDAGLAVEDPAAKWGRPTPRIQRPGSRISSVKVRQTRVSRRCRSRASSMPERSRRPTSRAMRRCM